jgi:cell division FtsZ-interacting protein ZapD
MSNSRAQRMVTSRRAYKEVFHRHRSGCGISLRAWTMYASLCRCRMDIAHEMCSFDVAEVFLWVSARCPARM